MGNNVRPTIKQQRDFLFKTFFGTVETTKDELDLFISRAYRDMNRTLRGIAKLNKERKEKIDSGAKQLLKKGVLVLGSKYFPENPAQGCQDFDKWHSDLCLNLKEYYKAELGKLENSDVQMTYGQAQKWVNMTLKYCWVCGEANYCDLKDWFSVAHMPVDSIILEEAENRFGIISKTPEKPWSTWDDQQDYQDFQAALRQEASKQSKTSMELEYEMWQ